MIERGINVDCKTFKETIDNFLEGELNPDESQNFEEHLKSCEPCSLELKSIDKCTILIQKIFDDSEPPESIKNNILKKLGCDDINDLSNCCPSEE